HSRGGSVDAQKLATQLDAPVVLVSAVKGEGIDAVRSYLAGQFAVPRPLELPILQDVPRCRQWSAKLGNEAKYKPPAPPVWTRRLDGVFLHPIAGPLVFLTVVIAVFQTIFTGARPLMDGVEALVSGSGAWLGKQLPESWWRDLLVEGVWGGVGSVLV